jgi:hypothetical protein
MRNYTHSDKVPEKRVEKCVWQNAIESAGGRMLQILINSGANVNQHLLDGSTPLLLAIERNKTETVLEMLQAGAAPSPPGKYFYRPLELAVEHRNVTVVRLLLKYAAIVFDPTAKGMDLFRLALSQDLPFLENQPAQFPQGYDSDEKNEDDKDIDENELLKWEGSIIGRLLQAYLDCPTSTEEFASILKYAITQRKLDVAEQLLVERHKRTSDIRLDDILLVVRAVIRNGRLLTPSVIEYLSKFELLRLDPLTEAIRWGNTGVLRQIFEEYLMIKTPQAFLRPLEDACKFGLPTRAPMTFFDESSVYSGVGRLVLEWCLLTKMHTKPPSPKTRQASYIRELLLQSYDSTPDVKPWFPFPWLTIDRLLAINRFAYDSGWKILNNALQKGMRPIDMSPSICMILKETHLTGSVTLSQINEFSSPIVSLLDMYPLEVDHALQQLDSVTYGIESCEPHPPMNFHCRQLRLWLSDIADAA